MTDKINREIDAHKALRREAEKVREPSRVQAAPGNPFTVDNR